MTFNAFSPLNGGNLDTYQYRTESPYDLDAGLDFTRQKQGDAIFPFPNVIGYVDGFVPLVDKIQYHLMRGRNSFGPGTGVSSAPANIVFPNIMGGLKKVNG